MAFCYAWWWIHWHHWSSCFTCLWANLPLSYYRRNFKADWPVHDCKSLVQVKLSRLLIVFGLFYLHYCPLFHCCWRTLPCLSTTPWRHTGGVKCVSAFLTLALYGGQWLASYSGHFTCRERTLATYQNGAWVGPRVCPCGGKEKISTSAGNQMCHPACSRTWCNSACSLVKDSMKETWQNYFSLQRSLSGKFNLTELKI